MDDERIVITGASSELGQALIKAFLREFSGRLIGIVSPRSDPTRLAGDKAEIRYIAAELSTELAGATVNALGNARCVLHLAWVRGTQPLQAVEQNLAIIDNLTEVMADPRRLYFMSSVSAAPDAPSAYGQSKFAVEERVRSRGGNVLVSGLVVSDPPLVAFSRLIEVVKRLPISVRLFFDEPKVYPISLGDLETGLAEILRTQQFVGTGAFFLPGGIPMNEFMAWLEQRHPRRRLPLWLPARALVAMGQLGRQLIHFDLGEKIATLLHNDDGRLARLALPRNIAITETEALARESG